VIVTLESIKGMGCGDQYGVSTIGQVSSAGVA
jgi:hypothetical protein